MFGVFHAVDEGCVEEGAEHGPEQRAALDERLAVDRVSGRPTVP